MLTASFFPTVAAATNSGWQHEQSSATSL